MSFRDEYVEQMKTGLAYLDQSLMLSLMYGCQPTEQVHVVGKGEDCPSCSGYGGSHGPEHGFPGGWTCDTCRGSGRLKYGYRYSLERYLPYPEGDPRKGTERERAGYR
jgi:DnaJ-class molecular chaperone